MCGVKILQQFEIEMRKLNIPMPRHNFQRVFIALVVLIYKIGILTGPIQLIHCVKPSLCDLWKENAILVSYLSM